MAASQLAWTDLRWSDSTWREAKWRDIKASSPRFEWRSRPAKINRLTTVILTIIALATFFKLSYFFSGREYIAPLSEPYLQWGRFEPMAFPGFLNSGILGRRSCDTLKYNGTIGVQKSRHLYDNLEQIALSMDGHPVVSYSEGTLNNPDLTVADIVNRTWARLSGSSVWLADQGVFLAVTRVVFLGEKEILSAPKASFLRGQLFDENWQHLENHSIHWNGNMITFPLVFDIQTEYEGGDGEFYGPEDPRIIVEEGVNGAEPVIIFNMAHKRSNWKRAMYAFRPFSQHTTILTIRDAERPDIEKNWAPFFLPAPQDPKSKKAADEPNEYIHFVYSFKPLRILKCHLRCGDCDFAFEQKLPLNFLTQHREDGGNLNGGTNFVPLPIPRSAGVHTDVRAHVAFPRTHVKERCGNRGEATFYRPEFIVMISFRGQFHLAFASNALDFGDTFVELTPKDDPCETGRILVPNSISRWDMKQDVMTITCSVDDKTVQVARLHGLLQFVRKLPQWRGMLRRNGPLKGENLELMNVLSSWVGDDVRACSVESALNYTLAAGEMHDMLFPAPNEPNDVDHSMRLRLKAEDEATQPKA